MPKRPCRTYVHRMHVARLREDRARNVYDCERVLYAGAGASDAYACCRHTLFLFVPTELAAEGLTPDKLVGRGYHSNSAACCAGLYAGPGGRNAKNGNKNTKTKFRTADETRRIIQIRPSPRET